MTRPIVLLILDGWGYSQQKLGNAILSAGTPNLDVITANYPSTLLQASGKAVGLGWGEPGNSEVGHITLGAGRTIFQYITRINSSIENGSFFANPAITNAMDHAVSNNSAFHLIGLVGSGTVHSSLDHLFSLINVAKDRGVKALFIHMIDDGKDSGLKEAVQIVPKLEDHLNSVGIGKIATVIGRYFAMDRDNNWDRTKMAYNLWTQGEGHATNDLIKTLHGFYDQGLDDTHMNPIVLDPSATIKDNDSVMFFNFREDSMRQITSSFVYPEWDKFPRIFLKNIRITFMTQYIEDEELSLNVAFGLPEINNGLAEVISKSGLRQMHIAETEKFAHATYFFNGLKNKPFEGENDFLIESYKNHLEHPEMRSMEIVDRFITEYSTNNYDFSIINIANGDIMAHTGNLDATIASISHVDVAVGRIFEVVSSKDGILLITADHGNAESLIYKGTGDAETKHNSNPVPLYLIGREYQKPRSSSDIASNREFAKGILSDVAPTILELMDIPKPSEMTGDSILSLLS